MDCMVDGCERRAALKPDGKPRYAGLCAGHAQRKTRGQPLGKLRDYGRTGEVRLRDAALRLADAETDQDERRAVKWLIKAAQRLRRKKDNVERPTKTPE